MDSVVGTTARRSRRRASTGSVDGSRQGTEEKLERRNRSISPKMGARKRKHPGSETSDVASQSESLENQSKNGSLQPTKAGNANGDASSKMNGSSGNNINGTSRHFTRSKRGGSSDEQKEGNSASTRTCRKRQATSFYKPEQPSGMKKEESPPIQVYASILASLDERAYQRALLKDADGIAKGLLIPMALPWTHRVEPVVRNIPVDIDDLTEVVVADDGYYTPFENGSFGFGRFDGGQLRHGNPTLRLATSMDAQCSALRRSDDPGALELCTVSLPPYPTDDRFAAGNHEECDVNNSNSTADIKKDRCPLHQSPPSNNHSRPLPEGEGSLHMFEEVQAKRLQRQSQAKSCAYNKFISVRVNSSSSRATIIPPPDTNSLRQPHFLEAKLPAEVQTGKSMRLPQAQKVANELGSFNVSDKIKPGSTSMNVGRCQLMWSQKLFNDQPQRGAYYSRLTGSKMEPGQYRRPTEIRVRLKVDGKLYTPGGANKSIASENKVSNETVGYGIDNSFSTSIGGNATIKHCSLDSERLMEEAWKGLNESNGPSDESHNAKTREFPRFDCVPSFDGQICTICTVPGVMQEKSIHEKLNNAAKSGSVRLCTVCWKATAEDGSLVSECFQCGLLIHPSCCLDEGVVESSPNNSDSQDRWRCSVCVVQSQKASGSSSTSGSTSKSRRKSRPPAWLQEVHLESSLGRREDEQESSTDSDPDVPQCALCPYVGGAMSICDSMGEGTWVHEVCRLWANDPLLEENGSGSTSRKSPITEKCALCGAVEKISSPKKSPKPGSGHRRSRLIKCAGSKCCVYFHPMCALLSQQCSFTSPDNTNTNEGGCSSNEEAKSIDRDLCSRFTLSDVECEYSAEERGKNPGKRISQVLQVGFCGLHNPKRERTFYGMYPGGSYTENGVLAVPSLNR